MHAASDARGPAPLRAAPPRSSTPLPPAFGLVADPSTATIDDGTVFLGGSPLRLFRISERARDVLLRWHGGDPVGSGRAVGLFARRLVSAGVLTPRPAGASFGPADVTVVIPVRDRPEQLDRLLELLGDLPCVVVDDASRDAAATRVICARHDARFVGLSTNVGPGAARNAGLAVVESPLVAFVDSDCRPAAGWLDPLLAHFADPLVAAVAPRIVPEPRDASAAVARYEAVRSSLDRGPVAGLVRPGSSVSFVPSAVILVRTAVVEGADLFDPALRGGEDVDLEWRLADAGWDVRYDPSVQVHHRGAVSVGAFLGRRYTYGTSAGPLAARHGEALAPVQTSGWSVIVWLSALARRPGLAMAAQATSIIVLARRLRGLVRDPVAVATKIAGAGTARAALPAWAGVVRAWSPLLVLGLLFRRTRRAAAVALVVPALRARAENPGALDAARYVGLHVADDVAYGTGVWLGCARARTVVPLLPRVTWRARTWSSAGLREQVDSPRDPTAPGPSSGSGSVPDGR